MAIVKNWSGSWGGLPDLGITEAIQRRIAPSSNFTAQQGSDLTGVFSGQAYAPQPQQNYTPAGSYSQVLGTSNTVSGGGGGGGSTPQATPQPQQQAPAPQPGGGQQGPSELDVINQEFGAFNSFLDDQAGLAQSNFANTEQAITSERDAGLQDVAAERGLRTKELEGKALEGRQNERLNLQRVRQLLQDLDQRNAARLSITGGGSLSDALADRFGRTAQQSVGGVLQEGQRYQSDIGIEQERANQFYDSKKREIETQSAQQIAQARQQLNQNLAAIEGERRASAAEKQRARLDSWRNYYNNVNNARLQAANFQVQYDMWKRQLDAQLAAAQGYQTSDIAGQDFNPALTYAQNGLNIGTVPQGIGTNPQLAATYFNPGARPDQNEEDYLNQQG